MSKRPKDSDGGNLAWANQAVNTICACAVIALGMLSVNARADDVRLSIAQHGELKQKVSGADADAILKSITTMFASRNCEIRALRDGPVAVFNDQQGPFAINSVEDYERLRSVPQDIRVVGEINYCSGRYDLAIAGCSDIGGQLMTVRRFSKKLEPIIWAHELGHTTGLQHRDDPGALMNREAVAGNTDIRPEECTSFFRRVLQRSPVVAQKRDAERTEPKPAKPQNMSFSAFVETAWPEGVPYNLAKSFSDRLVDELVSILKDRTKDHSWSNIVAVLGTKGSPDATSALLNFLRERRGELSESEYLAVSSVPMSLGWSLATRSEKSQPVDQDAHLALLQMTTHEYWRENVSTRWSSPLHRTKAALYNSMVVKAFIALALSGSEVASIRLERVGQPVNSPGQAMPSLRALDKDVARKAGGPAAARAVSSVTSQTAEAVRRGGGASFLRELNRQREGVASKGGISKYYAE